MATSEILIKWDDKALKQSEMFHLLQNGTKTQSVRTKLKGDISAQQAFISALSQLLYVL